ncbi:MAG TPA: hypothetical protein VK210_05250 [Terriglobia bacterium]|nr:hypothetical protein [Terriglobia bacterium]
MMTKSRLAIILFAATLAVCFSRPVFAESADLTLFGGIQHQGKLTFQSAPGTASNFIQNFNPRTFGVFGAQISHGKLLGGEHTLEYAPNFIDSKSKALLYHSNLRIQPSLAIVKPYATAGIGFVHSGGNSLSSFGTKFAFNYGGGAQLGSGPVGLNMDVRGYAIPKIKVTGFTTQQRMDFVQVTAGLVFRF